MDLYRETLMEHYKNPHNSGSVSHPTHQATHHNSVCGDEVTLTIAVDQGHLTELKHQTNGCAIAIASASLLTQHLQNVSTDQALNFTMNDLLELLGTPLTVTRRQCAQVALDALRSALQNS